MSGKSYRRDRNEKKKPTSDKSEDKEPSEASSDVVSDIKSSDDSKKIEDSQDPPVSPSSQDESIETKGDDGGKDVIKIEEMELEKERQVGDFIGTSYIQIRFSAPRGAIGFSLSGRMFRQPAVCHKHELEDDILN